MKTSIKIWSDVHIKNGDPVHRSKCDHVNMKADNYLITETDEPVIVFIGLT